MTHLKSIMCLTLYHIAKGSKTVDEIADAMMHSRTRVRKRLYYYIEKGLIRVNEKGEYELTEKGLVVLEQCKRRWGL